MGEPKYAAGSVIDTTFGGNKMPDRLYIDMVYMKPKSRCWMYEVLSEKNNKVMYIPEIDIERNESKRTAKCYDNEVVKKMYEDGYRFCGNMNNDTAFKRADSMKNANYIKHIMLCDAVDTDGNIIDGKLGLWVMYNRVINNNGEEVTFNHYNMYQIK